MAATAGEPQDSLLPTVPAKASDTPLVTRRVLKTPYNVFGLSRRYYRSQLPSHDPEVVLELGDLCDPVAFPCQASAGMRADHSTVALYSPVPSGADNPYYPYPNRNAMLLGHWYWCGGAQKSQRSFQDLIQIVGNPAFSPADVANLPWSRIDSVLSQSNDKGSSHEWEDKSRWKRSSVTISIPFQFNWNNPGPKEFIVHDFHHRSILSILRETISNPEHARYFHYEPFELSWKPREGVPEVRVYGDLYMSPEFSRVHREIQEGPGEPGCHLQRVVAALMFWSDATQLTSFGTAKLWPLYLGFGNESKYRRCRPALGLLNHLAYFQTVSFDAFLRAYN